MTHLLRVLGMVLFSTAFSVLPLSPVGTSTPAARVDARTVTSSAVTTGGNPFLAHPWGVYKGRTELAWQPYVDATGTTKTLLGYIALKPKAKWFGAWIPNRDVAAKTREYITNSQAGNPDALVQMTLFRIKPWEHDACKRLPTTAEQASYKDWINQMAAAIDDTPTAIILQPDGPFALCAPHGSTLYSQLIAYSSRVLSALPRTSVYIEAGAADWPAPGRQGGVDAATRIVIRGGIKYARGFALNSTHYSSTVNEVTRGVAIIKELEARGYTGKKFVINTAENGHPFTLGSYTGPDDNNPYVCWYKTAPAARTCITLGIPPTADVGNTKWRLPATTNALAKRYVDAYLWFGRPWLYRQASPFVLSRAIHLVKSTPYR